MQKNLRRTVDTSTFIENLYFIVLSLIIGPHWFTWINKEDWHCFGLRKNWLFLLRLWAYSWIMVLCLH